MPAERERTPAGVRLLTRLLPQLRDRLSNRGTSPRLPDPGRSSAAARGTASGPTRRSSTSGRSASAIASRVRFREGGLAAYVVRSRRPSARGTRPARSTAGGGRADARDGPVDRA